MTTPPANPQANVEQSLSKTRVLWLGSLGSYVAFYVLTLFNPRPEDLEPNNTLFLVFVAIGLTATLASFVVKKRFFTQAEEKQQVELVQQGFIVATMMTEVGALLGLFDYFRSGNRYYYLLFIIAACGQLLHYPRREPFLHATFKTSTF